MALIKYSQYVFYPGGGPAEGVSLPITLRGGNVNVPLHSNEAGTTPLANPVTSGEFGYVEFYAPAGDYVSWFAGEPYHIPVDNSEADQAWPGTYVHTQSTPATTWTVNHHFGIRPSVEVVNQAGQVVDPDVSHTNDETTVLTFNVPTGGVAYLRR